MQPSHFAEAPGARWVVALGEAVPILARAGCRSFCAWIKEPAAYGSVLCSTCIASGRET